MKYFLIRYHFANASTDGSKDEWHAEIARFISALENDPATAGKISYRAMRTTDGDYYHLAAATDDTAQKALGECDFFERYTQKAEVAGGGNVVVEPLEIVAETTFRA